MTVGVEVMSEWIGVQAVGIGGGCFWNVTSVYSLKLMYARKGQFSVSQRQSERNLARQQNQVGQKYIWIFLDWHMYTTLLKSVMI